MSSNDSLEMFLGDDGNLHIPESLRYLVNWYGEYAKEVVTERAIANIDGFKPSQRRILYSMHHFEKVKDLTKSTAVVGATLKLHPHGDQAIYDTMVRMIDSTNRQSTPFIRGKGSFGRVYSNKPPAAARYTEVAFTPLAEELFRDMAGIQLIPTEDGHYTEPEVLPVTFPNILTNVMSGIAVGLASNIAPFNFHEINEATIEMIETGDTHKLLAPDFSSKGCYVYDEKELHKIMTTGRGRIKVRGKWHVDNKTIIIDEIPYYTTQDAIKKTIEKAEIQGVSEVRIESDFYGLKLAVECSNKRMVDSVLTEVLRVTDLQMSMTTNITVIINDTPRVLGVKELLTEWIKFRTDVLSKQLKIDYDNVLRLIAQYTVFSQLINDESKRLEFTETLAKQGAGQARSLLVDWFPDAEGSVFDWILDMKIRQFSRNGEVITRLENYKSRKVEIENDLTDVPKVIARQLRELNSKYSFPRQTEVTEQDFVFEKSDNIVVKAEPVPVVVIIEDKFLKKLRLTRFTEDIDGIRCMSDDVISFIDDQGRLLRANLDNIEFHTDRDRGVYLPVYLEVEDDFKLMVEELVGDKKVGYVYSDGFASVVDYSEWFDSKRTTRITQNGVSPLSSMIIGEFDFSNNYLLLFTRTGKFGFVPVDFKQKHRTARTKLVPVKKGDEVTTCYSLSYQDIMKLVASPEKYMGKLSLLTDGDTFNSEYMATLI